MHLDGRPIRGFTHPYVEIFALSRLEKEHIVAIVEFGELVELVEFGFGVEFCIFPAMWKQRVEIIEKMSVSVGHASRTKDEDSLLMLYKCAISRGDFGGFRIRQRLVDGSHGFLKRYSYLHATTIPWCGDLIEKISRGKAD